MTIDTDQECELCEQGSTNDNPVDRYLEHDCMAVTACAHCAEMFDYEFWYELN